MTNPIEDLQWAIKMHFYKRFSHCKFTMGETVTFLSHLEKKEQKMHLTAD